MAATGRGSSEIVPDFVRWAFYGGPMPDLDGLRRTYSRIANLPNFYPGERIWWIYMHNVAIEVASRGNYPDVKVAVDRLKAFLESMPIERAQWLALHDAVA